MICIRGETECPRIDCPGRDDPGVCHLLGLLAHLRHQPPPVAETSGERVNQPDEITRNAMDADLCRFGSGPCGCGSKPRHCSHPAQPDLVYRRTCLLCPHKTTA